jgi:hypothetical protein
MLETGTAKRRALDKPSQLPHRVNLAEWNRRVGWLSTCLGAASGLILGLWSFDGPFAVPGWLGEYDQTGRRLARLGHIAFFGLGILNILIAGELRRGVLGRRLRWAASWAMNFGNVFLPLTLFAAAAYRPLKYFMSAPAVAVFVALLLTAYGVCSCRAPSEMGRPDDEPTA